MKSCWEFPVFTGKCLRCSLFDMNLRWRHRLARTRTQPSQGCDMGSNPIAATSFITN
jgi:hypothetical protein